jgi:hypothetical protein
MTFHLQTDKKLFRFHIIFIGMNPMKDGIPRRCNGENPATAVSDCSQWHLNCHKVAANSRSTLELENGRVVAI